MRQEQERPAGQAKGDRQAGRDQGAEMQAELAQPGRVGARQEAGPLAPVEAGDQSAMVELLQLRRLR